MILLILCANLSELPLQVSLPMVKIGTAATWTRKTLEDHKGLLQSAIKTLRSLIAIVISLFSFLFFTLCMSFALVINIKNCVSVYIRSQIGCIVFFFSFLPFQSIIVSEGNRKGITNTHFAHAYAQ